MEVVCSSEKFVDFQRTTRHYTPEDSLFHVTFVCDRPQTQVPSDHRIHWQVPFESRLYVCVLLNRVVLSLLAMAEPPCPVPRAARMNVVTPKVAPHALGRKPAGSLPDALNRRLWEPYPVT